MPDDKAPKRWRGRFLEDFDVGDVYRSRLGRTVTTPDNVWITCLTMNTNPMHFNMEYARTTKVRAAARQQLPDGRASDGPQRRRHERERRRQPRPESEVLEVRPSRSRPTVGIVTIRTRGVNQRGEIVIEFRRSFMIYSKDAPEAADGFPDVSAAWTA